MLTLDSADNFEITELDSKSLKLTLKSSDSSTQLEIYNGNVDISFDNTDDHFKAVITIDNSMKLMFDVKKPTFTLNS